MVFISYPVGFVSIVVMMYF